MVLGPLVSSVIGFILSSALASSSNDAGPVIGRFIVGLLGRVAGKRLLRLGEVLALLGLGGRNGIKLKLLSTFKFLERIEYVAFVES